jgi:hypothetical protein
MKTTRIVDYPINLSSIFLIAFCIATPLFGQEITKEEIIKFKIKSITALDGDGKINKVDYYNDKGNLIKIGEDINGKITIRKEYVYDANNLLVDERILNPKGELHHVNHFYYNANRQLTKKESKKFNTTWEYEYDEVGNKIKEVRKSGLEGNNSTTTYKYDDKRLINELTTDDILGKEKYTEYKYNEKGQLIESKAKYFYFKTTIKIIYQYNADGKLFQADERPTNGVASKTTYQYDNNGILVGDIWRGSTGKPPIKTTYQFEYFE